MAQYVMLQTSYTLYLLNTHACKYTLYMYKQSNLEFTSSQQKKKTFQSQSATDLTVNSQLNVNHLDKQ